MSLRSSTHLPVFGVSLETTYTDDSGYRVSRSLVIEHLFGVVHVGVPDLKTVRKGVKAVVAHVRWDSRADWWLPELNDNEGIREAMKRDRGTL